MAGLLDIFGTGGSDTMGLLGMSPEAIQRNRDDAQAQALYALAGRLFQGGNTGASIVQGLQQGQQAYKGTMNEAMQGQLQNYQLQELLRKRKEEEVSKQQQLQAQQVLAKAYRPETFADTPLTNIMGQQIAGPNQPQEAGGGLRSVTRELMGLGPAGMTALQTASGVEKALRPEGYTLGEGQIRYEIGADGKPMSVATGAPKREDIAGDVKEARQVLGITSPIESMTSTDRALIKAYIDRKEGLKAPKVSVDLNDQTAVAKQKLATINQWQGTLKDTGDTTVAGRASAFYDAYGKAKQGNTSADGALIYNIAKVYDQTGAVQQGDVNTIIGNRSIPTNIQLFAEKLAKGGTFTPKERDNLKLIVDGIVEERQKALEPTIKVYRGLNSTLGGKPEEIINPYDTVKQSGGSGDLAARARAELERRRNK
jgi:hypothetical protein